jgi:hypothetical protein
MEHQGLTFEHYTCCSEHVAQDESESAGQECLQTSEDGKSTSAASCADDCVTGETSSIPGYLFYGCRSTLTSITGSDVCEVSTVEMGGFVWTMSCCTGNLCNDPATASASGGEASSESAAQGGGGDGPEACGLKCIVISDGGQVMGMVDTLLMLCMCMFVCAAQSACGHDIWCAFFRLLRGFQHGAIAARKGGFPRQDLIIANRHYDRCCR